MAKFDLVAIPFHDWKKNQSEGFRTRDAHLLQEFSRHPSIDKLLIVDRPISLVERLVFNRNWKVNGTKELYNRDTRALSQVGENTFVLDIRYPDFIGPITKGKGWISGAYQRSTTIDAIKEAFRHLSIQDPVFYISSPLPIPLIEQIEDPFLVFDAVDNLTKIPAYASIRLEIARYYSIAKAIATIIFTNSEKTRKWLAEGRQKVYSIPNGVDPMHLAKNPGQTPPDLAEIAHPIVGYAGKMQEMFSIEIISYAAQSLPDTNFVLIGQQLNPKWMKPLWKIPNVHYLGDKHYQDLPNYLAGFDICVVPYSEERQHDVDPIKFYEYLYMEKPVITTNVGSVQEYSNFPNVKIASDPENFAKALSDFLEKIRNGETISAGNLPKSVFWKSKADQMIHIIETEWKGKRS